MQKIQNTEISKNTTTKTGDGDGGGQALFQTFQIKVTSSATLLNFVWGGGALFGEI